MIRGNVFCWQSYSLNETLSSNFHVSLTEDKSFRISMLCDFSTSYVCGVLTGLNSASLYQTL